MWGGEPREKLHDGGELCVGRGRAEECVVTLFRGLFFRFGGSEFSTLRLELEAHADFVSTGVEVLPIDQG